MFEMDSVQSRCYYCVLNIHSTTAVVWFSNINCDMFPIILGLDYRQSCSGNKDFFGLIARAALAISAKKFLLPEQKWIDSDVHARPMGDIFSEHMST